MDVRNKASAPPLDSRSTIHMAPGNRNMKIPASAAEYAAAAALVFVIMLVVMRVHTIDVSIPFAYSEDAVEILSRIKNLVNNEHGKLLYAPYSPEYGNGLIDFLSLFFSGGWILIIRFIALFTDNVALQVNVYYLLTYFFVAFTSIFTMRQLKFPFYATIPCGVLFAFLPGHFFRGTSHLLESSYYSVPLMCLILIWIWSAKPIFFKREENKWKIDILNRKSLTSIIVLLIIDPINPYFTWFFVFLALSAGVSATISRKRFIHLVTALILIGLTVLAIAKERAPGVMYRLTDKTVAAQERRLKTGHPFAKFGDTEILGLKIAQMVLPVNHHRVEYFRKMKQKYNKAHVTNENRNSTIGFVGSIGFLFLLSVLLFINGKPSIPRKLAVLNITAVLLASIGGFSALIQTWAAMHLSPASKIVQVRSYNRISFFIAFFAFLAIAWSITKLSSRISGKFGSRRTGIATACCLGAVCLLGGLYDQTTVHFRIKNNHNNRYIEDKTFFNRIDLIAPENGMIFQLPFLTHHEPAPYFMRNYADHARGHIFSNHLKWTYGGDRHSEQLETYRLVESLPPGDMLPHLKNLGFAGLYIDSNGFEDHGADILARFENLLGEAPIRDKSGRLFYFDLQAYFETLSSQKISAEDTKEFLQKGLHFSPRTIGVYSNTDHGIGELVQENGQWIATSDPREGGFLAYGPYLPLKPGAYKAEFVLDARGEKGASGGTVDVAYDLGKGMKKSETIVLSDKNTWTPLPVVFDVFDENKKFEFRVISNGVGTIRVKDIFLYKL